MPTPINGASPANQCYDPELSTDEGAGGASSVGYEGGSRGAGNASPSRPPDQTDDRCFREETKAALACGKLIRGFDFLQAAACIMELAGLASCVADRVENTKP